MCHDCLVDPNFSGHWTSLRNTCLGFDGDGGLVRSSSGSKLWRTGVARAIVVPRFLLRRRPSDGMLANLIQKPTVADMQQPGGLLPVPVRVSQCFCYCLHFGLVLYISN